MIEVPCAIMMVTYNRLELTKKTLENLRNKAGYPYRLIIIDNGSSDSTPNYLRGYDAYQDKNCIDYVYQLNEINRGISIGRNQGLRIADSKESEWYCCLDNDLDFPPNFLRECIEIMQVNPNFSIGVNMEVSNVYPLETHNGKTFQVKHAGNLGSAMMCFSRKLHKEIGFFYTDFPSKLYASEDAEIGVRIRAIGYKLGYLKEMGLPFPGNLDTEEYRKWKDECHKINLIPFRQRCSAISSGKAPIYVSFTE